VLSVAHDDELADEVTIDLVTGEVIEDFSAVGVEADTPEVRTAASTRPSARPTNGMLGALPWAGKAVTTASPTTDRRSGRLRTYPLVQVANVDGATPITRAASATV
jgi:hypothetical protein